MYRTGDIGGPSQNSWYHVLTYILIVTCKVGDVKVYSASRKYAESNDI